ncbi:sugar transferase [Microbacterium sp. cx-59]|uniref:sugar transferase n=1 Tax=Microbacterium sp. cx-59 TaxID=2891207 RepID=UPI001E6061FC|nr:sugar transferase [Microbacterium sp. cx-59]MCC4908017.1 sugar transferase [Microbacterium sp. cx-59]
MLTASALTLESVATPRPTATLLRRLRDRQRHRALVTATDAAALTAGAAVVSAATVGIAAAGPTAVDVALLCSIAAGGIAVWLIALAATRSRSTEILAASEYRRLIAAAVFVFAAGASVNTVAPSTELRVQVLLGVPVALAAVLLNRTFWRRWAPRRRRLSSPRTLLVGSRADLDILARTLQRDGRLGYHVVGTALVGAHAIESTVVPDLSAASPGGVPILGPAVAAAQLAREIDAEIVMVAGATDDADFIRRLSWQLEGTATSLTVATLLTDVAAGRMSLRTAPGLALMNLRIPTYTGAPHRVKRVMDVLAAACAIVPIALVTPLIAAAIRLDSPGPVFFRQRRVGRDGHEFDIVKFRTMRPDAESELAGLSAANEAAGALFKVRRDPRVTRVGAILRKYSIDELPQFWNVLRGDMSVVGPRPPLPSEVRQYDDPVFRRLYLRPGITGPWQIGGRSDLSWQESVRLDLHYVENWSVPSDIGIMLRTAGVVLRAKGAY